MISVVGSAGQAAASKPAVVLAHGAFADASGWNSVAKNLQDDGCTVVAPANPLRGLPQDAAYVAGVPAQEARSAAPGEAGDVRAGLGEDHLRGTDVDAGDRHEELDATVHVVTRAGAVSSSCRHGLVQRGRVSC
ncbi:hypothetical protein ACIREM_24700 [Streptomyces shenzhenensis]|uniref:hypothetical protein n=1 Tax=Streptomyces shenzhenensis TaxID=943815 RepID=UPI00380C9E26